MIPSEKAIQSRIKEAFAYKIEPEVWQALQRHIEGLNQQAYFLNYHDKQYCRKA